MYIEYPRMRNHQIKTEGINNCFFRNQVCYHVSMGSDDQVVQKDYKEFLINKPRRVRKKRPNLWKKDSWSLHKDNALTCQSTILYLWRNVSLNKRVPVLQHPPNSPEFTTCHYSLFPRTKSELKGIYFQSGAKMEAKPVEILKTVLSKGEGSQVERGKS